MLHLGVGTGVQVRPQASFQISKTSFIQMPSSFFSWRSFHVVCCYPQRTSENQAPLSLLLFFCNCFPHALLYLLWDRVITLRHLEDSLKCWEIYTKDYWDSYNCFLPTPHPSPWVIGILLLFHPLPVPPGASPWSISWPVPFLELQTYMFIFLEDRPRWPPGPQTPHWTHCLYSQACSSACLPPWVMVSLPSGYPNRKPESQCAHEVTEFWQLLFHVFDVYSSVHLLSEYILNSLLTHLSYSSPIPPIHFLHRQNSNILLCHSDHQGISGSFQGFPHALNAQSQFLCKALSPSLLLPSTPQAEYSGTPVPSHLWASAWTSFCLGWHSSLSWPDLSLLMPSVQASSLSGILLAPAPGPSQQPLYIIRALITSYSGSSWKMGIVCCLSCPRAWQFICLRGGAH